jgi:hypothetical protein
LQAAPAQAAGDGVGEFVQLGFDGGQLPPGGLDPDVGLAGAARDLGVERGGEAGDEVGLHEVAREDGEDMTLERPTANIVPLPP